MGQELETLVDSKLNARQQRALAVRSTSSTLGCTKRRNFKRSDYCPLLDTC